MKVAIKMGRVFLTWENDQVNVQYYENGITKVIPGKCVNINEFSLTFKENVYKGVQC